MKVKITGIIVSAGLSSRMDEFKPLLKYNGISFIENIIHKLNLICDEIIIVTGHNSEIIIECVSDLSSDIRNKIIFVHNENYEEGMFKSLQKGLSNCNSEWIIYHFVDQPNLPEKFYFEFVERINNEYDWIQPIYKGRKGHPIIFNKEVIKIVLNADINSTLKSVSASRKINKYFWDCNYKEIHSDIDTINDYLKLKEK